jgi:hypothetical protein
MLSTLSVLMFGWSSSSGRRRDAMSQNKSLCPHPGCTRVGNFARSMCSTHYLIFRRDCKSNGSWYSGNPLASPIVIPHFVWEGDEESLARMCEEQEKLRERREREAGLKSKE